MSTYTPDRWVVLKLETETDTWYKVFAGWYGGYLDGDSWKLSSSIVSRTVDKHVHSFANSSGSTYHCYVKNYGLSVYMAQVLESFNQDIAASNKPYTITVESSYDPDCTN